MVIGSVDCYQDLYVEYEMQILSYQDWKLADVHTRSEGENLDYTVKHEEPFISHEIICLVDMCLEGIPFEENFSSAD